MGALAVALGIGTAIANGSAAAWAEDSPGAGGAGSTASSSGTSSSGTGASAPGSSKPASTGGSARVKRTPGSDSAGSSSSTSGKVSAVRGIVTSSGGALTSGTTTATAEAEPGAPTPAPAPALWALAASARREFEPTAASPVTTSSAQAAQATTLAAAAVTTTGTLNTRNVGFVTGPNITNGFGINGTDLGIMWENGLTGKIQLAFGDTFSGPNMTGDWRSNVLLLSTDTNLTNGLSLLPTGYAYQFIPSAPGALFPILNSEVTIIPTSAISVNQQQYVNYMSVKSWDTPGRWTTNYSAISMYDAATDKWVLVGSTIRSAGWFRSSTPYVAGSQNFQQAAYVLQPADQVAEGEPQYVYAFGTPSGRAGSAYLSRVAEGNITDLSKYEYWDGSTWVQGKPAVAAPILGDSTSSPGLFGGIIDLANNPNFFGGWFAGFTGAKTGGNVSEMSVQYNDYLGKYVALYGNGQNNVVLRTADRPEGPWSDPITIATSAQYPGLYAPMIHPWSGTGKLVDNNNNPDITNLYWNMSLWGPYNVTLMQTDLTPLHTTVV
ncbi:DUF4185 domain-containing protein [Mycobacterium sp. NBC_00419]|uniref:DUF4185 domain-containing protein n=1 Tax=Mycobacterium sp. NBC_00419 TaxID=2975989 RepID=UPI002E1E2968